jgi:hypothetical protein
MIEHVIGYETTKGDSLGLIKGPVDSEINPALAIFFLGLRQRRETARLIRTDVSVVIASLTIELVGNECECDAIGTVESPHYLEDCSSESSMAGRISGERRREIRAIEIAGGRTQRAKAGIAMRIGIAIAEASRPCAGIRFANA